MTAATLPQSSTPSPSIPSDARLTFPRILRSEWIKLTSLRSTLWSLALIVMLGVGLSLLVSSVGFGVGGEGPSAPDPGIVLTTSTIGVAFGQLIAAVLGVLVISGEYSTGMIRSTLAAVPARLPVLAAKAIVLFLLVTAVGALTMFGAWAASYPVYESQGLAVGLDEPGLALALAGAALYLGLTAVFALGLGTLLRSAAGGIAAALGVILVIPTIVPLIALAFEWVNDIAPYLISNAGAAMSRLPSAEAVPTMGQTLLEPWVGALVVLAWSAVSLTLGAIALRRRDA
jgi:ABC-2 type transport system permease protein